MINFEGKKVLVTGSSSGIGKETAFMFARLGADVIVNGTNVERVMEVSKEIESMGRQTMSMVVDVSKYNDVVNMFEQIESEWGYIDILVNNAGITDDNLLINMSEEQWDRVINVNLKSVFNCSKMAAKMMIPRKYGKIINLTSSSAQLGNRGQVNYVASKGGILSMTKTIAKELARFNINCNAVSPGYIKTPMTNIVPEKIHNFFMDRIASKRMGEAEEISNSIAFLASDISSYIIGQIISINGGIYV
jgi:3-oxoacyl-[acyl-carrier protein] reductase